MIKTLTDKVIATIITAVWTLIYAVYVGIKLHRLIEKEAKYLEGGAYFILSTFTISIMSALPMVYVWSCN